MSQQSFKRGATLIELIVGILIVALLSVALLQAFVSLWNEQAFGLRYPSVQEDARQMANILGGAFRRATLCTSSDSGCTLDAAISGASSSGVTIYTRPSSALVLTSYGVTNGVFWKNSSGVTTNLFTGANLAITYYTSPSYNSSAMVPYFPNASQTPSLAAVRIQTTITRYGITGTYSTIVRLRNSPKRN